MPKRRKTINAIRAVLGSSTTFALRAIIAKRPFLYFNALKLIGKDLSAAVTKDSDILLAGIYGCANTYAHEALGSTSPQLRIAHHMHVPAQIVKAAKLGIPTLILIRNPLDCITSFTTRGGAVLTSTNMHWCLRDYSYYYDAIIKYRQHFVTTDFKEVVTDYPAAMERVNARFGTDFQVPANDSEAAKAIVQRNKVQGTQRWYALDEVKEFLQRQELADVLKAAEASYQRFCQATQTPVR